MPNGLVIPGGVSFPILAPDGTVAAPSYSFANSTGTGLYQAGNALRFASAGTQFLVGTANDIQPQVPILAPGGSPAAPSYSFAIEPTTGITRNVSIGGLDIVVAGTSRINWGSTYALMNSAYLFGWASSAVTQAFDVQLGRLAAASLRLGSSPSATPVAYTLTVGEASRPGTDSNVGGASGTIRSGLGTGTGTASSLLFQTPDLVGAGSTTQTYTTRLTVATAGITATVPCLGVDGAVGAPTWSFANDPNTGVYSASADQLGFACGGVLSFKCYASGRLMVANSLGFSTAEDVLLGRIGAASLRVGGSPSATPIAQTFTVGEASRPGTDSNVGGASGTFRSGLGTGTGTASSLLFQTPDLVGAGSTTQTYTTRLTVATALATIGVNTRINGLLYVAQSGAFKFDIGTTTNVVGLSSAVTLGWTTADNAQASLDTALARLAAASLRQGLAPSATPVAQTFTIGEASRAGTDLNTAGANGTIRSGLGTGNAAGSSLIFQVPSPIGSSTIAQTYTQVMSLSALGATFDIPDQSFRINGQVSGAGASAGTLTNAPAAGNPSFWLPINVGGTVYFFPGW